MFTVHWRIVINPLKLLFSDYVIRITNQLVVLSTKRYWGCLVSLMFWLESVSSRLYIPKVLSRLIFWATLLVDTIMSWFYQSTNNFEILLFFFFFFFNYSTEKFVPADQSPHGLRKYDKTQTYRQIWSAFWHAQKKKTDNELYFNHVYDVLILTLITHLFLISLTAD